MKYLSALTAIVAFNINAQDATVAGAQITHIQFYGSQFTVFFDKSHTATRCGHNQSVAMDSSKEPGKSHMATFLTVWAANKRVTVTLTDNLCSGDRPTLKNWTAY